MEYDPHLLLEGDHLAAYACEVSHAFIYIRGELRPWPAGGDRASRGLRALLGKNILGSGYDLEVTVHRGAGAYICGEETALIDSLEGNRGHRGSSRLSRRWGASTAGRRSSTTCETLANVPAIVRAARTGTPHTAPRKARARASSA